MKLHTHEDLITEISDVLLDLAAILEIPSNIDHKDDHAYIKVYASVLSIESYPLRRVSDVMVSSEVFCEVLMDIKGGMSVLEAFNKQGYTFNK